MTERLVDLDRIAAMSDLSVPDSFKAGQDARAKLRLDELDQAEGDILVRASTDVTAMSTRFLIGLLQPSVEHFGDPTFVSQNRRAVEYSLLPDTEAVARNET